MSIWLSIIKRIIQSLALSAMVWLGPLPAAGADPFVYVDQLGRQVTIEAPCRRVVLYETYELLPVTRAWDRVAGLSRYAFDNDLLVRSNPDLKSIPNAGSALEANLEYLLSLEADLVITWPHKKGNREIGFWEDKGLTTIIVYPETLEDLYGLMRLHARVFDAESEMAAAEEEMKAIFRLIDSRLSGLTQKKKACWLFSKPNNIAGRQGAPQVLFDLIRVDNLAPADSGQNMEVSMEFFYRHEPDVVFIWGFSPYEPDFIAASPQWSEVKAAVSGNIFKAPPWSTFSPRLAPLALLMAEAVYPEYFVSVDVKRIVDDFYHKVYGLESGPEGRLIGGKNEITDDNVVKLYP